MGSVYSWKESNHCCICYNKALTCETETQYSNVLQNLSRLMFCMVISVGCQAYYTIQILIQTHAHAAGIPLNVAASFRFHVSVSVSHMAKVRCNDTLEDNTNVSACTLSISTRDKRPAGIRCFLTGWYLLQMLICMRTRAMHTQLSM